ncbi:sensor histidine kinase [Ruegeria atlantica]|uniref:sensor histidine kinase n=1 Tax=Ruegeria atlantica TaxID=81569 RepID=UPI00147B5C6B|nr:sensor histidine kinase [Ruegeria atlantica]
MEETEKNVLRFHPKARIIRTIGDQLISGPEAAVIELVKNAYDADATYVAIKFAPPLEKGDGRISISDDGHGMALSDIQTKWMEPATSSKLKSRHSPKKKRIMMGSKGIGRFAAAKLGQTMSLVSTTSLNDQGVSILIPELDWNIFNDDVYLSDIEIDYLEQSTDGPTGTTIEINRLHEDWTKERLAKLHQELRRLLSPFLVRSEDQEDFKVYMDLSECTPKTCGFDGNEILGDAEPGSEGVVYTGPGKRIHPFALLTACDYQLTGTLEADGSFKGEFINHRAGQGAQEIVLPGTGIAQKSSPGQVGVQLYVFDRESDAVKSNMRNAGLGDMSANEAKQVLNRISGVSIYRQGFRIRPYGDEANDWLALDTRRVQNPSLRIGHNQIAGYLKVGSEEESNLFERSSREGFEDNEAFMNLTNSVKRLLAAELEPRRFDFRDKAGIARSRNGTFDELKELSELKRVRKFLKLLDPNEQEKAERIIDAESERLSARIEGMRERQRVLEAKSSLGAILAEVLHEGRPEAAYVQNTSEKLQLRLKALLSASGTAKDDAHRFYQKKIPNLKASGDKLAMLFNRLSPLAGGRRQQPSHFYPMEVIRDAVELFDGHHIETSFETEAPGLKLFGHPEDLTTAIVNLTGNSIHWLEDKKIADPKISVIVTRTEEGGHIFFEDNGHGVPQEFAERIFEVRFTLKDGGTGLGLNIAREALARSGASLKFHSEHRSGTLFEIVFPAEIEN